MTARRMVWEFIQTRDYQVMRKVHRWRPPRWLRFWMIASTRLGDGWVWYSVGIALLLIPLWFLFTYAARLLPANV